MVRTNSQDYRNPWLSAIRKTFRNAVPVEETSNHCLDVVRAAVLPVEIIGVFPNINNCKRYDIGICHRRLCVRRTDDREFSVF